MPGKFEKEENIERPRRTNEEWKGLALSSGKKGKSYLWSNVDRKFVRSTNYILEDGTMVGVPESDNYGVEIRYTDDTIEYPE